MARQPSRRRSSQRQPQRDRDGVIVYLQGQDRPRPNFRLDIFHRSLLWVSAILAVGSVIYGLIRLPGFAETLPMQYSTSGEVIREGSAAEAFGAVFLSALVTVGFVVLARFPRIYNFPFVLNEHNVQRQYKNAVHMMAWVSFSCGLTTVFMAAHWFAGMSVNWVLFAVVIMVLIVIFFIWRMVKLR